MVFFNSPRSNLFKKRKIHVYFKSGNCENLENSLLKMAYQVWRLREQSFLFCLTESLIKSMPYVNFKSVRSKGTFIKVPHFILEKARVSLVLNWIYSGSEEKPFFSRLEAFLLRNPEKQVSLIKRKKLFHEAANQYKVFAQKRWF